MLIKRSITILWVLFACSCSAQDITFKTLQTKLTANPVVRGEYKQQKTLKMFKQPLRSSGHFLLSEQQGLQWSQTKPFLVSLVLTKNKLSQQFTKQSPQIIGIKDNPLIFYFSHLFLSVFKGDIKALSAQFKMQLKGDNKNWSLSLVPKNSPLNKVFKQIKISGGKYINQLLLTELSGDTTNIIFSHQRSTPAKLTKHEQAIFKL